MGVTLRKVNGYWTATVHRKKERTSKRLGTNEADAKQIVREMRKRLARAELHMPSTTAESFEVYADRWIASAAVKASTKRFYRENLARYIYPVIGASAVADLTRDDVRRLLEKLNRSNLSPKTITGIVRTMSTVCSEAVEDGLLLVNPALRPGRLKRRMSNPDAPKRAQVDPYTRDEATALLNAAVKEFPEWAAFLLCALRTGMRLGELRALEWDDIDWRGRFIAVERNFVEGAFTTPKNGTGRRVDMSTQLRAGLRLHRRQQKAVWLKKGKPWPALVFPSSRGTPLDDANIRTYLRLISAAADVRLRRSVVHVFRHTFCSLLVQAGASLVYVKEQAGHSSIQITADVYAKWMPTGNRASVELLDALASGSHVGSPIRTSADSERSKLA